jgi:putative oxidoreductase
MSTIVINKTAARPSTASRVLNIALWILQVLLGAMFLWHGLFMLFPPAEMVAMINANIGAELRIFIGVAEVLAVAGLILPGLTRIRPSLTALAAACLMLVMVCATVMHASRGETSSAITTAILLVFLTAVAVMRWKVAPIAPRNQG